MHAFSRWGTIGVLILMLLGDRVEGAISGLQRVASGLSGPIFVTHAPGDRSRLFIMERGGAIKILDLTTGTVNATPFLSIPSVDTEGEGGLLGLAFHPDYATNGKFYVNVTLDNGGQNFQGATSPFSTRIRQYTVSANPNVANAMGTDVLSFIQPQSNHNGGWIGFNPAVTPGQPQYLYIPTGDGGGGNDHDNNGGDLGHTPVTGNAQDITGNLLGKILRIDVNGDDFPGDVSRNYRIPTGNPYKDTVDDLGMPVVVPGDDEILALGLRNPFRDSFDRKTGDLWLGDVGQNFKEEIDKLPANTVGGDNFGWRNYEGFVTPTPSLLNYRQPAYDYNRNADQFGGTVVTGGYVYRGPDPSLQGKYFFLDSRNSGATSDDNYWTIDPANPYGTVANIDSLLTPNTGNPQFPVTFGEDAVGNLYIAYLFSGDVYRIATNQVIAGDYDGDGDVDNDDYAAWSKSFGSTTNLAADGNKNNVVDAADYAVWRNNFGTTAQGGAGAGGGSAVPEPATIALFVLGSVVLFSASRRVRTRRPR